MFIPCILSNKCFCYTNIYTKKYSKHILNYKLQGDNTTCKLPEDDVLTPKHVGVTSY